MIKTKLILLLLMVVATATAQEKVNYLKYKEQYTVTTKKKSQTVSQGGKIISFNDKQIVANVIDDNGEIKYGLTKIYDKKNNVIVYDYFLSDDFYIEDADTLLYENAEPKPTNKTETINGYKCKAYELCSDINMLLCTDCSKEKDSKFCYTYTVWLTEDIITEDAPKLISMPLMGSLAKFVFKGVIVRIDRILSDDKKTIKGTVELVKAENKHDIKLVAMPWTRQTAKSIIPHPDRYGSWGKYTSEKLEVLQARLVALRKRITGREKFAASHIDYINFPF